VEELGQVRGGELQPPLERRRYRIVVEDEAIEGPGAEDE